uniref:Uncharacterized protein n=1 Tax=Aegilops tauschii TaxID=37682 RepID=N1R0D2_AEGTA
MLSRLAGPASRRGQGTNSVPVLWARAVLAATSSARGDDPTFRIGEGEATNCSMEERAYMQEAMAALRVAKEVLGMQEGWRKEAVREMNRTGRFSRPLANSATDWPCLLLDVLSGAAEEDFFQVEFCGISVGARGHEDNMRQCASDDIVDLQPKLVLNNVDALRKATCEDDTMVPAAVYHDSFIWRVIALGANEQCLPVIMSTSDGYYSSQAFVDFGFPNIFISRETFGWTPQEAKLHMVSEFFSEQEVWKVVDELLGPNPRQLCEIYMLKQKANGPEVLHDTNIEEIIDTYLAHLQVSVVNPAMQTALSMVQKFASDVREGKVPENRLSFGAPWRHPPRADNPDMCYKWAKIQLMDFVQSYVNTEFGLNYLADDSLEILDDPAAVAMMEMVKVPPWKPSQCLKLPTLQTLMEYWPDGRMLIWLIFECGPAKPLESIQLLIGRYSKEHLNTLDGDPMILDISSRKLGFDVFMDQ